MMWLEMVMDVFWPSRGPGSVERIVDKKLTPSGTIPVEFRIPGELTRCLNESGWLAEEVIAAGVMRQGKPPSLLGMITGLALIEVVRPRRSKSLPREFTLAVTAERVVAFAVSPWRKGDGETDHVIYIKRDERGSWPRESLRMIDPPTGGKLKGRTLELAGLEPFPVTWDGDDSTDALIDLVSR
jgi:hypothetical protein